MSAQEIIPKSAFHIGEQEVQRKLGVRDKIEQIGRRMIRDHMPQQHRDFFENLPFLVAGHADQGGAPWASLLFGAQQSFVESPDDKTLLITAKPVDGDPLAPGLSRNIHLGLLGIELHSRRRNRLSGHIQSQSDDVIQLAVDQSFGNCPQYIQHRSIKFIAKDQRPVPQHYTIDSLDSEARSLIQQSDTFFVASHFQDDTNSAYNGVDVSHRGGKPGFVHIDEKGKLTIPDYAGNNFYNTLGNIHKNPKAGLLFVDFESGHMLSLTGTAEILWDSPETKHFNGAHRLWQFTPEKGIWLKHALPFRWEFKEFSPNSVLTGDWAQTKQRIALESNSNQWRDFIISKTEQESSDVTSFYLKPESGPLAQFTAGQYITLKAKVADATLSRNYSLSSAPDDGQYRISVKRDGVFSRYLHQQAGPGSRLQIRSPRGNFSMMSERNSVFLAAGIGITPMLSMAKQAYHDVIKSRSNQMITLFFQVRDALSRPFFSEINQLERLSGGLLRVYWIMSKPEPFLTQGKDFHIKGHISRDLLQSKLLIDDYDFFLCGPANFTQDMYDSLLSLGVDDKRVFTEAFGPAALTRVKLEQKRVKVQPPQAQQAIVTFTHSELEQSWTPDQGTLLEFAEEHGLTLEYGCRNGQCGSCKVKVIEGEASHSPHAEYPLERNEALLCCAVPAQSDQPVSTLKLDA